MPTLYVRDFPDELHQKIKKLADRKHRSLSAEVIVLIDEALKYEEASRKQSSVLDRIAERRRSYTARADASNSLELLREDRER
ncbi:MAG: FitA-like ribbon-helix-helix domain-containing protein [Armatimonadota bacterium]